MKQFEKFNTWLISKDKIAEPPMTPQDKYGVDKVASGFRKALFLPLRLKLSPTKTFQQ